jgi:hypothetical protein
MKKKLSNDLILKKVGTQKKRRLNNLNAAFFYTVMILFIGLLSRSPQFSLFHFLSDAG